MSCLRRSASLRDHSVEELPRREPRRRCEVTAGARSHLRLAVAALARQLNSGGEGGDVITVAP
jgi:hypothetical protein